MQTEIELAVLRAIDAMQERLGDELKIDDLAQAALFSKFHFSRVFQRVTGLSPGRFLSALRLAEAKRLLTETALPVTEISVQVGYSSVGTFSSRFKGSVGVSPTNYRQAVRISPWPDVPLGLEAAPDGKSVTVGGASVRGTIWAPETDRPVFAGLFPGPIQQGRPVRCAVLARPGEYVLEDVPPGSWHLMARTAEPGPSGAATVGHLGPITVRAGGPAVTGDLRMRPARRFDPPVLLALHDLRVLAERFEIS